MPPRSGGRINRSDVSTCNPGRLLLRLSMSLLATVVSDGSPGSSLLTADGASGRSPLDVGTRVSLTDALRARLGGGTVPEVTSRDDCFLCLLGSGMTEPVDSSPSSPDASREEGCRSSAGEGMATLAGRCWEPLRLRFEDGGEDMVADRGAQLDFCRKIKRARDRPEERSKRAVGIGSGGAV